MIKKLVDNLYSYLEYEIWMEDEQLSIGIIKPSKKTSELQTYGIKEINA